MVNQTINKGAMEQMDLLLAFEKIMDLAKGSSLGDEFYQKADAYLGYVSDKLGISKRASAILSLFANKYGIDRIELTDFADYLGCRMLSLLRYTHEIQELMDKEYIFQYTSVHENPLTFPRIPNVQRNFQA